MCNYVLKIRLLPSNVNKTTAMIGRDFVVGQADWLHSSSSLLRIWLGVVDFAFRIRPRRARARGKQDEE